MLSVLGPQPSFGFGDRLGLATEGHCEALLQFGGPIKGIFAQQSIREMGRTGRSPDRVMGDAEQALKRIGFDDLRGADADHLKTKKDVDDVIQAGFTFFTIDPSDFVNDSADGLNADEVRAKYDQLEHKPAWFSDYENQEVVLDCDGVLQFDEIGLKRCLIKYGTAIRHACDLGDYICQSAKRLDRPVEIEMSIDETEQPTTSLEHYVFADRLIQQGLPLVSVAPRFVGNFEKGIDFFGDREAFEKTLRLHASIARHFGCYKLSLHSGSDKLSIYSAFARETRGRFHVKTAGTSYLEAIRLSALADEKLYREIVEFSRKRFEHDRATYHLSNGLNDAVEPASLNSNDELLQEYLMNNAGRQILHVTFGSVLNDPDLGPRLMKCLQSNSELYKKLLVEHFRKHLEPLTSGIASVS